MAGELILDPRPTSYVGPETTAGSHPALSCDPSEAITFAACPVHSSLSLSRTTGNKTYTALSDALGEVISPLTH